MSQYGARYEIEIRHPGLNKYRHISGRDESVVRQKAQAQLAAWDEQWQARCIAEEKRLQREKRALAKEEKKALAADRTEEAEKALEALRTILASTLSVNDTVHWEHLKDKSKFPEKAPEEPKRTEGPEEPRPTDLRFRPGLGFLDRVFRSRRERKEREARARFDAEYQGWLKESQAREAAHKKSVLEYEVALNTWKAKRAAFLEEQQAQHRSIDAARERYMSGDSDAIEEYNDMVLSRSEYPSCFPKEHEVAFIAESGILVIEYKLPARSDLPTVKQVRYIASRDQLEEVHVRESELNSLYDGVVYQTCLRTIHEVLEADQVGKITAVVFNGWVEFTDPATGKDVHACIVSVQASRDAFSQLNLAQIDPRACFKALKGVGSSKLHSMVPVVPVLRLNREDKRFVESVDVAERLSEGTNVAAIGWEDFEHLIREIFEKEFSTGGGEVKVTRASRDGGVDAVAFDPDPIRGGKIVIQAKRYTNTVGVSAVRDLYGTVMNEGATKGILVTTSTFGPDAYEFAKDKPLTLLDGGNLLHLLGKHGHRAYINLNEAKKLNTQPLARSAN